MPESFKNIVIGGGSYGGCAALLALRDKLPAGYRIIVVEPRSHFHYTFAFLRASVVPDFERDLFIPYNGLFPSDSPHFLVHAKVSEVTHTHVVLDRPTSDSRLASTSDAPTHIPYTYLVYAAGAQHPSPTEMTQIDSLAASVSELKSYQSRIISATSIVIVGGGGSGIELAAEIAERYPRKEVVLVHSRERYMEAYGTGIHDVIRGILEKLGVRMVFGERVAAVEDGNKKEEAGRKVVRTIKGTEIEADLVLWCTGLKPRSAPLQSLSPSSVDPKTSFVKVLPTLQLADVAFPNIFACGDIADTADMKLARTALIQAGVVAENILALISSSLASPGSEAALLPTLKVPQIGMLARGIHMPMGHSSALAIPLPPFGWQVALNTWFLDALKADDTLGAGRLWKLLEAEGERPAAKS
ncbi:FAD/NAD(P)-binding domain-containing protein [Gonapodya prolifera JEL478]|uniref:FAD/NAD(P)-binding domain-containing protein n=1 Tax=Gonapodya prolifera (strain JEL478) TaxID=1344416 RepID=A0A139AGD7_GONPJ|nr:FAD/NAD(P)-binding domain-containing protein [Gonapodya prolifera JEL478]|eukprot:KXS15624.1 FAD/NAD(P)-binding domain-containing protein [Gonapodya prolifera JEL478]